MLSPRDGTSQLNGQGTAKFRRLPCSGHGRLVTTCHHAMLRTERERFDQRFVARHGSIAPAPTKKYVKHQAFNKKLSNMCPQVRSTGIGHKTSSFSRPRCLRQGLHCTQEGPQSLHVVCSPRANISRFLFSVEPSYRNNSRFKRPVRCE